MSVLGTCGPLRALCQILIAQRAGYSYEEIAAAFAIKPRMVYKHVATADLVPRGE